VAPSETPLRGVFHPQHHYACEGDEIPLLRDLDLLVKTPTVAPSETPLRGVFHPQRLFACQGEEHPLLRELDLLVKNTNSGAL
jgi:hypothetical protein